jgi:signal transduction histidine kinase
VESLRSLAFEKKIGLEVTISDAVPEVVLSDVKKLQQIIANLLSNAIKFTSQGGVMVKVESVDKSNWQINVIDSGIGIPSDALSYIFEPFRQVDNSDTRKYKGTGLGLSITKRLAEILGGEIKVESTPGRGSTFTVIMPRTNLPETAAEKAEAKK